MAMGDNRKNGEQATTSGTTEESNNVFDPFFPRVDKATISTAAIEDFDPFHIDPSPKKNKAKSIIKDKNKKAVEQRGSLPPRMEIKFKLHEEISSTANVETEDEGSSDVFVEGTVLAQVTSSDALKNAPFILVGSSRSHQKVDFEVNETYGKSHAGTAGKPTKVNVIKIPKSTVGFVTVGKYKLSETIEHMPLLLERKVVRSKGRLQVAIQVRTKLSNPDDLSEVFIALSMSNKIIGDSVEINTGAGEWDRLTRTVIWRVPCLPKGESCMVSARAMLTEEGAAADEDELEFPVMLRCRSQDQISTVEFKAIEASGYPATVSSSTIASTYRIVHRLK